MKKNTLSIAIQGVLGAAFASSMLSTSVYAQQRDRVVEEVIVTGSRLSRPDLDSVSPMTVVSGEEFKISGTLNVEQKLAELPSTIPSFGPSSNNPGDGTARVDLRGLGDFRTLVLVNGRRWIPATQTGVVDLNSIPGTLIKQVDVVTGGASAVYGSDALAGVVNFQLVDDFEGVEITGLYDITTEGDAEKYNFDITMGGNFDDGRGNAVVFASFSNREALYQGEREFSSVALGESGGALQPGGSSGIPGTRVFGGPTIDPDGVPASGDEFALGRFLPDGTGTRFVAPDDLFNYAPDNFLQLPQERYLLSSFAHYDVSDSVTIYGEMAFSRNKVPQELAPTPAFTTVTVNPDSPYFTNFPNPANVFYDYDGDGISNQADIDARIVDGLKLNDDGERLEPDFVPADAQAEFDMAQAAADTDGDGDIDRDDTISFFVGRRMVENGPRQSIDTRDAFRVLTGVKGDLTDTWSFDAYYSKVILDRTQLLRNDVSASRFIQAILVEDGDDQGNTACVDPSNGCAPLNIFGEGNISQEAIDFISVGATNITSIEQEVIQANVSGTVATLPGAQNPIGIVFGYEHRADESSFEPDTFLSTGDVLGFNAGQATIGSYKVQEFFTEFNVPILEGQPGAESLSVWGAYRYSDYSNIGGTDSYALAMNYAPASSVKFRVGYQQAVRAPNVNELFQGTANGFPGASDPCTKDNITDNTDRATCIATGMTASQVGITEQPNSQIEGSFGGESTLQEETSNTFTIGAIIEPMEGLDISIDYYDIEIEDAIDTFGGGVNNILDLCYNVIKDASDPICQAISRRASDGNVNLVTALNANIGAIETSGVDFNVNYTTDLGVGVGGASTLSFNFASTYVDTYDRTPVAEFADRKNFCAGNFGNTCGSPINELVFNLRTTWTTGPLTLSSLIRYLSEADDDQIENGSATRESLVVPTIDEEVYLDVSAAYQFSEAFRVNLGVNNILDTEPTQLGNSAEQANTFPSTYDLFGPRVFLSASYKFQ